MAAYATVERHHTENKAAHAVFDERIRKLENEDAGLKPQFSALVEKTADLRKEVHEMRSEIERKLSDLRPMTAVSFAWRIVPLIVTIIGAVVTIVLYVSRYPTRDEFQVLMQRIGVIEIDIQVNRRLSEINRRLLEPLRKDPGAP